VRPNGRRRHQEPDGVEWAERAHRPPPVDASRRVHDIEALEHQPVDNQHGLRRRQAPAGGPRRVHQEHEVSAHRAANRDAAPGKAVGQIGQRRSQRHQRGHRKRRDRRDGQRDEAHKIGQAGDRLRAVAQCVYHRGRGNGSEQHGPGSRVLDHPRGVESMRGVRSEVDRGPPAADQPASVNQIPRPAFQCYPGTQHRQTKHIAGSHAPGRSHVAQRIAQEQRQPDDRHQHAQFVEPASADDRFPLFALHLLAHPFAPGGTGRSFKHRTRLDGRRQRGFFDL